MLTDRPLREVLCHGAVSRTCANQDMCRVQQRVGCIVGRSLVDYSLVGERLVDGQVCAAISQGVLAEQDGRCQSLDGVGDVFVIPF